MGTSSPKYRRIVSELGIALPIHELLVLDRSARRVNSTRTTRRLAARRREIADQLRD